MRNRWTRCHIIASDDRYKIMEIPQNWPESSVFISIWLTVLHNYIAGMSNRIINISYPRKWSPSDKENASGTGNVTGSTIVAHIGSQSQTSAI